MVLIHHTRYTCLMTRCMIPLITLHSPQVKSNYTWRSKLLLAQAFVDECLCRVCFFVRLNVKCHLIPKLLLHLSFWDIQLINKMHAYFQVPAKLSSVGSQRCHGKVRSFLPTRIRPRPEKRHRDCNWEKQLHDCHPQQSGETIQGETIFHDFYVRQILYKHFV